MRPFPFNLTGPQFLLFFGLVGSGLLLYPLARRLHASQRDDSEPLPRLTEPLQIAALRGGYEEAVRLAILRLLDLGLLQQTGDRLKTNTTGFDSVNNSLDRAILNYFSSVASPELVFKDGGVRAAGLAIEQSLESLNLRVPRRERQRNFRLSMAALGAVAAIRISLSGPPFMFLILEIILLFMLGAAAARQGATAQGLRLLSRMRGLFVRLKRRARDLQRGVHTDELALLAAVFGFSELPYAVASTLSLLRPKERSNGSGDSSGCSSGCGSGSGCGGGCGGGCGS